MLHTLETIFGTAIAERPYSFPKGTIGLIRHGYSVSELIWDDRRCLLVTPREEAPSLVSIKKQVRMIEELCNEPVIIQLPSLSSLQRTNLIESGISFISGKGQVFIPFWGSYFEEKIRNPIKTDNTLSGMAQLVFLYLYYHRDDQKKGCNQMDIVRDLAIPKASLSRAIRQLRTLNLISANPEGAANRIIIADNNNNLSDAFSHMSTPIYKRLYVHRIPDDLPCKLSGIKALSEISMISALDSDGGYAIAKASEKLVTKDLLIDETTFRDFGGHIIDIWKYDPYLLSNSACVDDLSLLLELNDEKDERVQKELDQIREKYHLEVID